MQKFSANPKSKTASNENHAGKSTISRVLFSF